MGERDHPEATPCKVTLSVSFPLLMTCTAVVPSLLAKAVTLREPAPLPDTVAETLVAPRRMKRDPKWA